MCNREKVSGNRDAFAGSLAAFTAAGLLLLCLGCDAPPFASVVGVVTLDGQPLADVEVQFLPEPHQPFDGPPTSAYTDKNGRYQIAATRSSGVVVGTHRICINDATVMMPGANVDAESGIPTDSSPGASTRRRSRVPTIYSDATRTPFAPVKIQAGTQTKDLSLLSSGP